MSGLGNPAAFFDYVRARPPLGPTLTQDEVSGCERLLHACAEADLPLSWAADLLATSYHETAGTLRPIREYGKGRGKKYGRPGKHGGQVAYGRGDVQLTWDFNYEAMDEALGLGGALIANYDLALEPTISAAIAVEGMRRGIFTGRRFATYLAPEGVASREQFRQSRRIINGMDRADLIAGYAVVFQAGLLVGGWV